MCNKFTYLYDRDGRGTLLAPFINLHKSIMATRSIINIEGIDFCSVYKHSDGYPSATLPWLQKFNREFTDQRGNDPSYKMAQLLRSSFIDYDESVVRYPTRRFLGWGVIPPGDNSGVDYVYTLHADGTVTYFNNN